MFVEPRVGLSRGPASGHASGSLARSLLGPRLLCFGIRHDVGALGPPFPFRGQFLHAIGLRGSEVVHLRAVGLHVVEFPRAVGAFRHEFPFAVADGAVALVFPEQRLRTAQRFAFKDRPQADAFQCGGAAASRQVRARRSDVNQVAGRVDELVAQRRSDARRPVRDERCGDAAFVDPVLVFAERRVRDVGPAAAVGDESVRRAGHDAGAGAHGPAVARLHRRHDLRLEIVGAERLVVRGLDLLGVGLPTDRFGARAVVLEEENERVVELPLPFQLCHDTGDALVHAVHHCRIDLHATRLPRLVLHRHPILSLRRHLPVRAHQAELFRPCEPRRTKRPVAAVVFAAILHDVLRQRVHRPVRRGVGHIEEERLVGVLDGVLLQELHRVVGNRVGVIELLRPILRVVFRRDPAVAPAERGRIVEVSAALDRAVEFVEPALERPVVVRVIRRVLVFGDVPLAAHVGGVAGGFELLGDGWRVAAQVALVARQRAASAGHVTHAGLVRVEAGDQRRARRAAACRVIELREPQPIRGERIQRRRPNLAAVAAKVGEAHVIGEDDEDVRPDRRAENGAGGETEQAANGEKSQKHGDANRFHSLPWSTGIIRGLPRAATTVCRESGFPRLIRQKAAEETDRENRPGYPLDCHPYCINA